METFTTWDSLRGVPCDECRRVLSDVHDYVVREVDGTAVPLCMPCYFGVVNSAVK